MKPVLDLQEVSVRFGDNTALDRVSLALAANETVVVLGPSGSGKSTLLRAIAGLEPLAHGRIESGGIDLAPIPTHRRGFGLMFQSATLFPHRDVLGNVMFGLLMQNVRRAEAETRARAALKIVGLAGFETRAVAELSGGEAQRVALARAIAPEPKLLMLDEPFGALDRPRRDELSNEVRTISNRLGAATLLVTHDHAEAFAIGDRIAIINAGKIEQVAPPVELWRQPATAFVASFLGWNIISSNTGSTIAVRPDAIRLTPNPNHGRESATVITRTFRRNHWQIRVETEDHQFLNVEIANTEAPTNLNSESEIASGSVVGVIIDPASTICFTP